MPMLLNPQGKRSQEPLDRQLGSPQSQAGYGSEEKKSLPNSYQEPNPERPAYSLVTMLTGLQLSCYFFILVKSKMCVH